MIAGTDTSGPGRESSSSIIDFIKVASSCGNDFRFPPSLDEQDKSIGIQQDTRTFIYDFMYPPLLHLLVEMPAAEMERIDQNYDPGGGTDNRRNST